MIDAAQLRIVSLPLLVPFVISTGTMTTKTFPLLVLKGDGIEGIAEGVMDPTPDYLEETITGAMAFLRDVLLPSVIDKRFAPPCELEPYLAPWRGNRMAKALLEMAFWDLCALDDFDLDYIEQPLAFDDIHDHAQVQAALKTAICLDESIRNASDARKALAARAARVINIKVGRVGGHAAARAVHDTCAAFGAPVWCGGMLEAGIGRAHNIHLSTVRTVKCLFRPVVWASG